MNNVTDIERFLKELHKKNSKNAGKDMTLERMWPLLQTADNPQDALKVIHIAGTSGKTSTAYFISRLLRQTGASVGLTVSPHIESLTERLQLNGSPIDEKQFVSLFNRFLVLMGKTPDATYFEFMIVFVLWSFRELGVMYAVVETGLGGMHDGTNVCRRKDKIAVITDIGFDHQDVLGDTISLIARQKAGIIHEGNEVYMYDQSEARAVVESYANEKSAHFNIVKRQKVIHDNSLPIFQQRNWVLANVVVQYIVERDKLTVLSAGQLQASKTPVIGRMFEVQAGSQLFILDGAHNQQKMSMLVKSFQEKYGDRKVPVVLAVKQGKDYGSVVDELAPIMSHAICTDYKISQDMPIQSVPSHLIAAAVAAKNIGTQTTQNLTEAIIAAKNTEEPVVLVTGSLYMISSVLKALQTTL